MTMPIVTFVEVIGPGIWERASRDFCLPNPDYSATLAALRNNGFQPVDRAEADEGVVVVVDQVSRKRDHRGEAITHVGGGGQHFQIGDANLDATIEALREAGFEELVSLMEMLDEQEGCGGSR